MRKYKGVYLDQIKLSYQKNIVRIIMNMMMIIALLMAIMLEGFSVLLSGNVRSWIAVWLILIFISLLPAFKQKIIKKSGAELVGTVVGMRVVKTLGKYHLPYGVVAIEAGGNKYEIGKIKLCKHFDHLFKLGPSFWANLRIPIRVLLDKPYLVCADFSKMYFEVKDDSNSYDDNEYHNTHILNIDEKELYNSFGKNMSGLMIVIAIFVLPFFLWMIFDDSYSLVYVATFVAFVILLIVAYFVIEKQKTKLRHKRIRENGVEAIGVIHHIFENDEWSAFNSVFVEVDGKLVEIKQINGKSKLFRFLKAIDKTEYKSYALQLYVLGNEGYIECG